MQEEVPKPFIEHLQELRKLLLRPFLVMAVVTGLAFWKGQFLVRLLQKPLNKTLYYSSPIGGLNFIFEVALICGFIISLPLFIWGIIKFLEPIMAKISRQRLLAYLASSIGLAMLGVMCGYLVSMPAALHFFGSFESGALKPLISANDYLSFALVYLAGFALLFQLPLIIVVINRIKPLSPRRLMHYQKLVVLASFIIGALLMPTPSILNQIIFASPLILLYQVSVALVFFINRKRQPKQTSQDPQSVVTPAAETSAFHPVGAVFSPQAVQAESQPVLRPIDLVLSHAISTT